jgi:Fe-S cluster assembly protein SufD
MQEPSWLSSLRETAGEQYERMQWPTPREEEWRRTDVSVIQFDQFRLIEPDSQKAPGEIPVPDGYAGILRFSGGAPSGCGLRKDLAGAGVRLAPLSEAVQDQESRLSGLFETQVAGADNRLIAWHYSRWTHGAFLYVPRFVEIGEPFLVEFDETGPNTLSMPHMAVVLDTGARALVVAQVRSTDEILCNWGADLSLGDGTALEYFVHQNVSPQSTFFANESAVMGNDASLHHFAAIMGGRLSKTRLDCNLAGKGAHARINGVYLATGRQHMDIRTVQHHSEGQAYSRSFYKGAVKDAARTVYQGLIDVRHEAPGTDAYLTNNNLVLNDGARSDSIPSLHIMQDDVRCSHGSTTGRIDEEQLFYLMSRGFPRVEAEKLLVVGYFEELLDLTPAALRDELLADIEARL